MTKSLPLKNVIAVTDPFIKRFALVTAEPYQLYHIEKHYLPEILEEAKSDNGTYNLPTNEELFEGLKEKLLESDRLLSDLTKVKQKRDKLDKQMDELDEQFDKIRDEFTPLNWNIEDKLANNLVDLSETSPKLTVMRKFIQNENKINQYLAKICGFHFNGKEINISDEITDFKEGDFGGSLYWEPEYKCYIVIDELAEEYIEQHYVKELDLFKNEINKLNEQLGSSNSIQFDFYYGIRISDDNSKANVSLIVSLKMPLPSNIKNTDFKKFIQLIETMN